MRLSLKHVLAVPIGVALALLFWWLTGLVIPRGNSTIRLLLFAALSTILSIIGGFNPNTQSQPKRDSQKSVSKMTKWLGPIVLVCASILILVMLALIVGSLGDAIPDWLGESLVFVTACVLLLLNLYIGRRWFW